MAEKATDFFVFLKITHNQVTFLGSMTFLSLSAFSFSQGNLKGNLFGLFFAFCHSLFDFIDGTLSRKTNTSNKLGAWSDPAFDLIGSGLLLTGIVIGLLRNNTDTRWIAIGSLALFGHYGVMAMALYYEGRIFGKNALQIMSELDKIESNFFDYIVKEFIFLKSFIFLFFGTLRYSLVVFVLLNKMNLFILFYAIFVNIRWMIMFFVYAQALNQPGTKIPLVDSNIIRLIKPYISSK